MPVINAPCSIKKAPIASVVSLHCDCHNECWTDWDLHGIMSSLTTVPSLSVQVHTKAIILLIYRNTKVGFTLFFKRLWRPLGRVDVSLYSILDLGTRRGEVSASRPGRFLPPEKTRYSLYRRMGGPQGRSGQVQKISLPLGFDPRTVQPVSSRHTDWSTMRKPNFRGEIQLHYSGSASK
jgi:hypothetical protein